ncbi:hypothetical protein AVEN_207394-1 [Araneus ventricosus]|uniref:Fatty acyl-CoA reductase n=1 Tax=Araneus ventricosus TaxID=182803 RepID=A0A4Y2J9C5_ARAVE|nr:hypothetical protein AVEN_207394-1 [Araneus ventricosus]
MRLVPQQNIPSPLIVNGYSSQKYSSKLRAFVTGLQGSVHAQRGSRMDTTSEWIEEPFTLNEDKKKLQELIAHCKPDWPNLYSFSKCLAENVITDTASDLPIAIIRPSIVFSTWKHPIPGYLEENFGITTSFLGTVGLGDRDRCTKGAGRLGESRINSDAFHDTLSWKLHSLLAGIHGTKPCGSQLQVVSTGLHGEVSRHFNSRAPGYLHLTLQFR